MTERLYQFYEDPDLSLKTTNVSLTGLDSSSGDHKCLQHVSHTLPKPADVNS